MSETKSKFDLPTQGRICAVCPNMCRFLCPVASVEKAETVTPRGKATLVRGVETGQVPWNEATAGVFYHCAGCKICREWCPSGVDLPEVMADLRVRAASEKLVPGPVRVLRDRLVSGGSLYRPAAELAKGMSRYEAMLAAPPVVGEASPAAGEAHGRAGRADSGPGGSLGGGGPADVLYFAGCSTAALHPEIIGATLRLFEAAGVKVTMLSPEECCGLPLDVLGYREDATAFARRLGEAARKSGATALVSGCPMCTYVIKERYPVLGATIEAEVKHTTEFLADLHASGKVPKLGKKYGSNPVTYQDPCYLGRYQGVYDAPRRLLTDVAGYDLVEMERSRELAGCCGGSPAVDAAAPRTATAIGSRRFEEARRTGAETLVTACPHCREMLGAAAEAANSGAAAQVAVAGERPGDAVADERPGRAATSERPGGAAAGESAGGSTALPAVRDITEVLAERYGVLPKP